MSNRTNIISDNEGFRRITSTILRIRTVSDTTTELLVDGVSGKYFDLNYEAVAFKILLLAYTFDDNGAGYVIDGIITSYANVKFIGTPTVRSLGSSNANLSVNVTFASSPYRLKIEVTGQASKIVDWIADVQTVELNRPLAAPPE